MTRWISAVLIAAVGAVALSIRLGGAEPDEGMISRERKSMTWKGGPFTASNPAGCVAGASDPTCDHVRLIVNAPDHAR